MESSQNVVIAFAQGHIFFDKVNVREHSCVNKLRKPMGSLPAKSWE